jgi:hypothetical protein
MATKTHKKTVMKAHKIARAIGRGRGGVDNIYAVGMAAAKKSAAKRRRSR